MNGDRAHSIPILASLDISETRDFYVWHLGFSIDYADEGYLVLKRGEIEIHFWRTDDRRLAENTSCYIRGGQVPALFHEFTQHRVPGLSPFEVRPWNMKEFYIHDPHGNLLKFGCSEW